MYYEKIFKTFEKLKVEYLVCGGLAVNLYGVPRFTKDIDVLVNPSVQNLDRLKRALKALRFTPKIPVSLEEFLKPQNWKKWKIEKGMIALNLYNPKRPFEELDLLVNLPLRYEKAKKNRACIRSGNLKVYLLGIDDLIRIKRKAARAQDLSDIAALKKVKKLQAK